MSMLLTLILNNMFVIVFIFLLYFFYFLPCSSGVHSLDIIALNIGNTEAENIPTTTSINKQLQKAIWHPITNSKCIASFSSKHKVLMIFSKYCRYDHCIHHSVCHCMLYAMIACWKISKYVLILISFSFDFSYRVLTVSIVYILILSNTLYCSRVCKSTNLMSF